MPNAFRALRFSTTLHCSLAFAAASCGQARGGVGRPETTLSASPEAQAVFRGLRSAWFSASSSERSKLDPELSSFVARFPADPGASLVRVLIAFDLVSRGAVPEARAVLARPREQVGAVRDFSRVVVAYAWLRDGQAETAWRVLDPLRGKVVDPDERRVFNELCLRAAMAARRYEQAVQAAEELLTDAPADAQSALQETVREQFQLAPKAALVLSLARLDDWALDPGVLQQGRDWLRKMVRERLVGMAVREKDVALSRQLLDDAPSALRTSELGSALVSIAGGGQTLPLISGRSIGVALSLGNAELRRRSANLSAGLSRALRAAQNTEKSGAVQLLTQDDRGTSAGTVDALRELTAEGAVLLVAGLDGPSADAAASFAGQSAIGVLLVEAPKAVQGAFPDVFILGESVEAEQVALDAELSRRNLARVARFGDASEPCGTPPASGARFSVPQWRHDQVSALLVFGAADCASELASELRATGFAPLLALGLQAAEYVDSAEAPSRTFALAAGRFPNALPLDPDRNRALPPVDWYEALGHDAALLATGALANFPDARVDEARVVRGLHARAERALGAAQGELWTSDSGGFSEQHVLPRTLTVVSAASRSKKEP